MGLTMYAIGGAAIGALSGWLTSLATKCGPRGVWIDALLGATGFLGGFIGTILMPWRENTVTEHVDNGVTVSTTINTYQHPGRVAVIVAVLLALLHEVYRWRQVRNSRA